MNYSVGSVETPPKTDLLCAVDPSFDGKIKNDKAPQYPT
jgi:hypothetical protein